MDIKTKFNLGDHVYGITHGFRNVKTPCKTCNSSGKLETTVGISVKCPHCYRGYSYTDEPIAWYISNSGIIGNVKFSLFCDSDKNNENERKYMISSTGIGSGQIWDDRL